MAQNERADKAILIDAENRTVKEVIITNYRDISTFGRFQHFDAVQIDRRGNTVYVDDEGRINGTEYGFMIAGHSEPLMGNGVILGTNLRTGESKDTDYSVEKVRGMVRFFGSRPKSSNDFDPSLNEGENDDLTPDPLDWFEAGEDYSRAVAGASSEKKAMQDKALDDAYDSAINQAIAQFSKHPNLGIASILEKAAVDNGIRGEENVRKFTKWASRQLDGPRDYSE